MKKVFLPLTPVVLFTILLLALTAFTGQVFKVTPTRTNIATKAVLTRTPTRTPVVTRTNTPTVTVTPTVTRTITPTRPSSSDPYPSASLCQDHDGLTFHTLWNEVDGCHYDHEHGQNPFTEEVSSAFPDFDLYALLGNVEIGHTNPSSPMENTMKHGGFKWQADTSAPNGCAVGFEGGTVAVDAYAIQYHAFGRADLELETRIHSTAFLLRQCKDASDPGYIFGVSLQDYGQRVTPYQGQLIPYPNNPSPLYDTPRGPYISVDNTSNRNINNPNSTINNNSKWTSKPTGSGIRPEYSRLFRLLFNVRDGYELFDLSDLVYPFHWVFVCGGENYDSAGCRYNNSTTIITEIMGDIPSSWDNLSGFDSDPRVGRITADGFVSKYGTLTRSCTSAGNECFPVKLVSAFVGRYSSDLCIEKCSNNTTINAPERDIYFCNGVLCKETDFGASPSGWIDSEN